MKNLILILFFIFSWSTNSFANKGFSIKEYFVTCEGILSSFDDGFKFEDKFFQDIKIIFYDISKVDSDSTPTLLRYEITSTNFALIRPTKADFFVPRKNDKDFNTLNKYKETMLELGAPLIKDGWKDGIIEIHSGTSETKSRTNRRSLNNSMISHNEVLNLNLNTLSIKIEMKDKKGEILKPTVRASCSQNNELLNSLKNFSSNSSGVFKDILGKYLGK